MLGEGDERNAEQIGGRDLDVIGQRMAQRKRADAIAAEGGDDRDVMARQVVALRDAQFDLARRDEVDDACRSVDVMRHLYPGMLAQIPLQRARNDLEAGHGQRGDLEPCAAQIADLAIDLLQPVEAVEQSLDLFGNGARFGRGDAATALSAKEWQAELALEFGDKPADRGLRNMERFGRGSHRPQPHGQPKVNNILDSVIDLAGHAQEHADTAP